MAMAVIPPGSRNVATYLRQKHNGKAGNMRKTE
jgi:hypothetical protein